jgi:hypothetical protein
MTPNIPVQRTVGQLRCPPSAVATLVGCISVLSLFSAVPSTPSVLRLACWFLGSPLAIIIGNIFYRQREERIPVLSSS